MTRDLEDALTRTLAAAAVTAPAPDRDFANAVHTRQKDVRRGRMGLTVAGSVLAVVAVVAGVSVYARPRPESVDPVLQPDSPSATDSSAPTDPPLGSLRSADQVWPGAVRRLPAKLPDGRTYTVDALLDGGRYVVHTNGRVLEWTPANGGVRELGHLVEPSGKSDYAIARVAVGDGHVAWSTTFSGATTLLNPTGAEVWTAPMAGGEQRRILEASKKIAVEALTVAGDDVIIDHGALSRIPVAGGTRALIPDSVDLNLSDEGPWAVGTAAPDVDVPVLNLITGERRTIPRINGITGYEYCSAEFCIATDTTTYSVGRAWNITKTQRVSFPTWCHFTSNPAVAACVTPITGMNITYLVWNVRSGQIARVPEPSARPEAPQARAPHWTDANGDFVLLDPAAMS